MSAALRRTSFSPNIKERRGSSYTVLDSDGYAIASAAHMTGHAGSLDGDGLALLLNNVRTPDEREGDLGAQFAACHIGGERLREICAVYGLERVKRAARELLEYSEEMMRAFLKRVPKGKYRAEDFLDNDGINDRAVKIVAEVTFHTAGHENLKAGSQQGGRGRGRPRHTHMVVVDFSGSDPQVE